MFCTNCGAEVPDGSKFCPSCGKAVSAEEHAEEGHDASVAPAGQPPSSEQQAQPAPQAEQQAVPQPSSQPQAEQQPAPQPTTEMPQPQPTTEIPQPQPTTEIPQPQPQPTTQMPQPTQVPAQNPGYSYQVPPTTPAGPQGTQPNAGKNSNKVLKVVLIILIVAIVVVGVGFGMSSLSSNDTSSDQQEEVTADTDAQTTEEDPGDADSKNVAYDEETDTYNSACLDDYDNLTAYALLELDGEQIFDLGQNNSYVWYVETDSGDEYLYRYDDRAAIAVFSQEMTTYDRATFTSMDIGSKRGPSILVNSVGGYSSSETAFTGASQLANVEDPVVDSESDTVWALVQDSTGKHYLVLVTAHGDGTYDLIMFNDEAVSSGLFESVTSISGYSSVDELWQVIKQGSSQTIAEDTGDSGVLNT